VLRLKPCPADDPDFLAALFAAGLPIEDLGKGTASYFALSGAWGGLAGTGPDRLIRSVVVGEGSRGSGVGSAIVGLLADAARDDGAARLWLLTTDAVGFFCRLGWRAVDRAAAPDAIQSMEQFASICPASASLMVREL
jgi:GNAT superfamily N-acetyltransferase